MTTYEVPEEEVVSQRKHFDYHNYSLLRRVLLPLLLLLLFSQKGNFQEQIYAQIQQVDQSRKLS